MTDRMSFCSQVFIWSLLSGVVPWTMPPFFWEVNKKHHQTHDDFIILLFSLCLYLGDIPMINISIPNWFWNNPPPTKLAELENCQLFVTRGFDFIQVFCQGFLRWIWWSQICAEVLCIHIYIYITYTLVFNSGLVQPPRYQIYKRINKLEGWGPWFLHLFLQHLENERWCQHGYFWIQGPLKDWWTSPCYTKHHWAGQNTGKSGRWKSRVFVRSNTVENWSHQLIGS